MKKKLLFIPVFVLALTVHAQGIIQSEGSSTVNSVTEMDSAVKTLAVNLNKKFVDEKAKKIIIGQFAYRGNIVPLGMYWVNQLTEELANTPNRAYIVLSTGPADADWIISGEFIDTPNNTIRIYTRLIRTENRAVEASFHFDFERNGQINVLLSGGGGGGGGGGGRSSSVVMDSMEADSFDNPVAYEIGADDNAPVVNRTLHDGDEDFFLLIPANDGQLVMETTGHVDTFMDFYNAETRERLAQNDDGGSNDNARIRYNVESGKRYIAKVRGFDGETGEYGFRAYLVVQVRLTADEYEPDNDSASAKQIEIGTPQQHTFHTSNDVDWVKFQITRAGRYTIRTRGVNTNRLDTYIELFDSNMNSIDEDDDGGENVDSRLTLRLENGTYYLKVEYLGENADQPYNISITAE